MIRNEANEMPQVNCERERLPIGNQRLTMDPPHPYPAAIINVTNRCNLRCSHCYLYVDGNPNDQNDQIPDAELLAEVERLRDRHGLVASGAERVDGEEAIFVFLDALPTWGDGNKGLSLVCLSGSSLGESMRFVLPSVVTIS